MSVTGTIKATQAACTTRDQTCISFLFSFSHPTPSKMLLHPVRPAHHTKHVPLLQYPFRNSSFHLTQRNNGQSNGTALWLGAQCLSLYLADICARKASIPSQTRPKLIELGSGIGLSAYVFPPSCSIFPPLHGVYSVLPSLSGSLSAP